MNCNLFINYYQDKNLDRQRELEICVLSNIYNIALDSVVIMVANKDLEALNLMLNKITCGLENDVVIVNFENRPTYNDYFKLTENYPNDINIISNKDVIMDAISLMNLKEWNWKNYCLSLSRWDFIDSKLNQSEAVHYNQVDSQDTWIMKGAFKQLKDVNFGLGVAGCDNKIALLLSEHYEVINPSLDIKTYHYHLTNVRNYVNVVGHAVDRIKPPYLLLDPINLPNEA